MPASLATLGAGGAGQTTSQAVTAALVAYWKMDEGAGVGNRLDSHSGAKHLTPSGSLGSRAGKISNAAADFDTGPVSMPRVDASLHCQAGQGFTFAAWIVLDVLAGSKTPFSIWDSAAGQSEVLLNWDGFNYQLVVDRTGAGDTFPASSPDAISAGVFTFVAIGYRFGSQIFLRTGANIYTTSMTGNIKLSTLAFRIGTLNNGTSEPLDGAIDEVGYFNRGLSNNELDYLYNAGAGRTYPL